MPEQPNHRTAEDYWDTFWPKAGEDSGGVPAADRMHWTQYPFHGPGAEFLAEPKTALEIGSASCVAGVALARTGVDVTCVDFSPHQMERARRWWSDEPNVTLVEEDVLDYLARTALRWDCVFSDWGAAWFIDPDVLLPLVLPRLTPGGRFAFSCVEPLAPCFGPQIVYGNGYRGEALAIVRWMLSNEQWTEALERHGFADIEVITLPGTRPGWVGTTLGTAFAPR
ncbi:class I SAM-dependent methyltransferase [Streptacidiphilus rugosus]|uniref:class I SAM-dependent methyltransferase n=1 Tax=Streptacidiphilus rugosus TaxID=405783 RepID=UPI00055F5204|nr:class I SAM-dependent methyltransferase [Streptacidiphilus rugosus]